MNLPEAPEELTPTWFSWAFDHRFSGTEVLTAEIGDIIAGTATKIRVHLTYNKAGRDYGLPRSVIVKGAFGRNADAMEHTFTHEMLAYRDLVSEIGLKTPKCYFAAKVGKNPVWIIEDLALTNASFGHAQKPLSFARARSVLDLLALLHAKYWQSAEVLDDRGPMNWILRTITGWHMEYMETVLAPETWAFYLRLPRGAAVPRAIASDPDRIHRALKMQIARHAGGPLTLSHGDAHIANTYFHGEEAGLLDWEMRRSPWYHDFTYFLVSSLDIIDRRRWEGALLQHYLEQLEQHGISVSSFDEAFDNYRREVIYGYIIFLSNGDGTQFWSEADNAAVTTRFAIALEDLGTIKLIEQDHQP